MSDWGLRLRSLSSELVAGGVLALSVSLNKVVLHHRNNHHYMVPGVGWEMAEGVERNMAVPQLSTPEPFDFARPKDWVQWCCWFERYRQASGLADRSGSTQVSTLVYCMGDRAEDILVAV